MLNVQTVQDLETTDKLKHYHSVDVREERILAFEVGHVWTGTANGRAES